MLDPPLLNEIKLIHLVHNKYRCQQRSQRWWKSFSILHRRLLRFVQQNKVDADSAQFLVDKLIPSAYVSFQSIIKQGAFITLGFALIAFVSRIHTLLVPYTSNTKKQRITERPKERKLIYSIPHLNLSKEFEDLGEDIGSIQVNDESENRKAAVNKTHKGTKEIKESKEHKQAKNSKEPKKEKASKKSKGSNQPGVPKIESSKVKKKKSKQKSVIDDIFS